MTEEERKLRIMQNSKGARTIVSGGTQALDGIRQGVPTYKFIPGKGMFLLVKHENTVYHLKMSTGGLI